MSEHIDSDDYTYDAPHLELVRPAELDAARKRIEELEAKLLDAVPVSERLALRYAVCLALEWGAELEARGHVLRFPSDKDELLRIAKQCQMDTAIYLARGAANAARQEAQRGNQ